MDMGDQLGALIVVCRQGKMVEPFSVIETTWRSFVNN
jgi:hypothetical protein